MSLLPSLLGDDEPLPFSVLNRDGDCRIILTCEHAGDVVPRSLNLLGMTAEDYKQHYALDVGTRAVMNHLASLLNAPAILGNYSRLVVDLNRDTDHPTTFAPSGEGKPVPGNIGISDDDKARRLHEIYHPYHQALADMIDRAAKPRTGS